jgi:hypothetical protein
MIKTLFFATTSNNNICDYYDFLTKEILPESKVINCFTFEDTINCEELCDVFVYRARLQENYYWGYIPSYEQVLECVKKLKPKIIIQIADEFYYEDLQEHNGLAKYCDLFVRQFNYSNYGYFDNTLHIPLGYYDNFKLDHKIIKPIKERSLEWSFVGCIKSDRNECIQNFSSLEKHFIHLQQDGIPQQISREQLIDIYLDSIFVPCSRGWTQLESNRIYESLMCGAIPVIVCEKEEYDIVFKYYKNPPFLTADSWEKSVEICKDLMNNLDELQKMQENNMIWWNDILNDAHNKVKSALL